MATTPEGYEDYPRPLGKPPKPPKNVFAFPRQPGENGMTLLDYFAGQVLCAVAGKQGTHEETAEYAYKTAHAMLVERVKHEKL